ncbi:MAG TPA: bacteriohemerythrin [Terracidiphilus sp.]|nr:bacteriohemerythrin [Terracidiphilus sp.]
MALMTWDEKLSVGVPSMDAQHVVLIETLNELHSAMMKGDARNVTGPLLRNLLAYTRNHFSAEEAMLATASYPELAKHKVLHRDLTQKVEELVSRFEKGELGLNLHLLHFLRDWLANHIQKVDRSYRPWITEHSAR